MKAHRAWIYVFLSGIVTATVHSDSAAAITHISTFVLVTDFITSDVCRFRSNVSVQAEARLGADSLERIVRRFHFSEYLFRRVMPHAATPSIKPKMVYVSMVIATSTMGCRPLPSPQINSQPSSIPGRIR